MRRGYERVSVDRGDTAQRKALMDAGVEVFYTDTAGGQQWDRPELRRMLDELQPGDEVVVHSLARVTRSLPDLLRVLGRIEEAGAVLVALDDKFETRSQEGKRLLQMLGAVSRFDAQAMQERAAAGRRAARDAGRVGGRRPKLSPEQRAAALEMLAAGQPAAEVARVLGVHRSTVTRLR